MEWRKYMNRKKPEAGTAKRKSDENEGGGDDSKTVKRSKASNEENVSQFQPLILDQLINHNPASMVKGQYLIQASRRNIIQASDKSPNEASSKNNIHSLDKNEEILKPEESLMEKKSRLETERIPEMASDTSNVPRQIEGDPDSDLFSEEPAQHSDQSDHDDDEDDEPSVVPGSSLEQQQTETDPPPEEHCDDDSAEKRIQKSERLHQLKQKKIEHSFM
jgi:hypothetical protein